MISENMIFIDYILIFPNWMLLQTKENSIVLFPTLCFSYFIVKRNKNKGNIGLQKFKSDHDKTYSGNWCPTQGNIYGNKKKNLIIRKALV